MTPVITIFVRHASGCKYAGDEFTKRCNCRKHFRWTQNGKQYRKQAGTRSWAEAEEQKRRIEDELAGRVPVKDQAGKHLEEAIALFLQGKRNQGLTAKLIDKYVRELARLREYCEGVSVRTVQGLNLELLIGYCATWPERYPASLTRSKVRERL